MTKISVVINTLNEEKNLPRALKSVRKFADEIVVVDMYSDDRTVSLAKQEGVKVYQHERTGYVEPARNYAISKATGDWILILDADEEISSSLRKQLREIAKEDRAQYFRLPRKNIIFGKWIKHSRWWPDYNIRYFRKGHVEWSEIIHSVPTTMGIGLDLPAEEDNAIIHHNYDSVEQYLSRVNRYSTFQAALMTKSGYEFNWLDLMTKPSKEFLSRYFQGEGYKDGLHGLALAGLQAFSEFVTYLKVWQTGDFKEQDLEVKDVVEAMKEIEEDSNYWKADTLLKEVGGYKNRIKRKLKIS